MTSCDKCFKFFTNKGSIYLHKKSITACDNYRKKLSKQASTTPNPKKQSPLPIIITTEKEVPIDQIYAQYRWGFKMIYCLRDIRENYNNYDTAAVIEEYEYHNCDHCNYDMLGKPIMLNNKYKLCVECNEDGITEQNIIRKRQIKIIEQIPSSKILSQIKERNHQIEMDKKEKEHQIEMDKIQHQIEMDKIQHQIEMNKIEMDKDIEHQNEMDKLKIDIDTLKSIDESDNEEDESKDEEEDESEDDEVYDSDDESDADKKLRIQMICKNYHTRFSRKDELSISELIKMRDELQSIIEPLKKIYNNDNLEIDTRYFRSDYKTEYHHLFHIIFNNYNNKIKNVKKLSTDTPKKRHNISIKYDDIICQRDDLIELVNNELNPLREELYVYIFNRNEMLDKEKKKSKTQYDSDDDE
jgi:hypothetical protein